MKILAFFLLIISAAKFLFLISSKKEAITVEEEHDLLDKDTLKLIARSFVTADSLLGLFCSLFILFMT